jgi:hypothetical protein
VPKIGRSYSGKRKPSHIASEASRLREVVQEREETIRDIWGMAKEGRDEVRGTVGAQALTDIMRKAEDALDGGGESP